MTDTQQRSLIVTADREVARFYRHHHPGAALEPFGADIEQPSEGDLHTDRPGRTFDSAGQGRHAMEHTSSYQRLERQSIAKAIDERVREVFDTDQADRLVLIADPRLLGELRHTLDSRVRAHVVLELDHHLTQLGVDELARRLSEDGTLGPVRALSARTDTAQ